ncbi:polyphosphate kinase 2 family protein [Segnochrobactrum spirostomi]|uniref:Polyphosphate kinase 2 family protein n=1 Tax=Segnochrobactrum spirostomi TaxID=2608987 RepID=A0A6A7XX65_9HYPH|nr:polyphosphate kinase 2 family protein [Segnochrobactrum spirostomi]MQT11150.1 polyphosphate kinase 2 family protein [Segnochrobactrum spirostomi]
MGLRTKLIVEPGKSVRLGDIDPGFHDAHESEEAAKADFAKTTAELTELQAKLYAEKKHALLVVLQGIDAAGKDGVCWHVIQALNPQGTSVTGFKQPTPEERVHDFLWRVHPHTPGLGQVAIFNRSHYEDVLVARVHDLVPKSVWSRRYDHINAFESLLTDSGVTILKFFLYISKEEQLARFAKRLDDPARQWKISESDYTERALWDRYIEAYDAMLNHCSTPAAPWYVIPSNHKWFRNFAVSQIIAETLRDMKLEMPKPSVDLEAIRHAYHAAAAGKSA